jgi:hypothetical protein
LPSAGNCGIRGVETLSAEAYFAVGVPTMVASLFGVHGGLRSATRLPALSPAESQISRAEVAALLLAGAVAAAATGFIRGGLRIPGSSIVLAALPISLGLALVPRRLAGSMMAAGAFSTAAALSVGGLVSYGPGAMTSLCLIGPMMDVALAGTAAGWRLYAAIVLAGVASNLIAMFQRGAGKLLGFDTSPTARVFAEWWSQAIVTYTLSGAAAGLLAAFCWFKLGSARSPERPTG